MRVTRGLLAAVAVTAAGASLCAASSAEAAFGPIQLISRNSLEQAGVAREPAISADGRYVAFCAELGSKEGVFREQLETGQVEPVAVAPIGFAPCRSEAPLDPFASAPSISADGRYVSFDTGAALAAEDTDEVGDVYVADMAVSPPTYRLASAVSGGEEPLPGGSLAAGRSAISADGDRVAFVNEGNVYVHDFATEETILVSARRDPLTGTMESEVPVEGGGAYEPAGAAISADGSTVAWVGEHLPEQVPLLADEEAAITSIEAKPESGISKGDQYHEPLWRRVPFGGPQETPTRRVVGGGDPTAPGCPSTGTLEEVACQGPYPDSAANHEEEQINGPNGYGWGLKLPSLDADGDIVALAGDPDAQYDLFVVDMAEGMDRREAVHQVTQWTNPVAQNHAIGGEPISEVIKGGSAHQYLPFVGEITDCAISADGTRVAFTSTRQHFSTVPFALITAMPAAVSQLPELYEVNLEGDTIERATPGPGQDVSEAVASSPEGASGPSFAGDRVIAFASGADNLVAGDADEASDVFTIESPPPVPVGQSKVSPRPAQTAIPPGWRMTANAYSRPDGEVRVVARVPAAGTLRAAARAQVGSRLKSRRVAAARHRSKTASVVSLELKLGRGRRTLARKPGLVTRISLTFAGRGGDPLHVDLQGRFVVHHKRPAKHAKASGR
jgi:Tol biopolymer transport system component